MLGKGRAIRCDTAWHLPAFGAVPCPDELGKCDLGNVFAGWMGNCSEMVIVLWFSVGRMGNNSEILKFFAEMVIVFWFQVKIPQSLDQVFLLSMALGCVCRDTLDVGRRCAY